MYEIKINFANLDELVEFTSKLQGKTQVYTTMKELKEELTPQVAIDTVTTLIQEPEVDQITTPETTVSSDEVREFLTKLAQQGKSKNIKELLTEYGAKKLSEVPDEKLGELLEKAKGI